MDTEMTSYGNHPTKALNICGYWLAETVYNPETFASAMSPVKTNNPPQQGTRAWLFETSQNCR
jgi:hypothetical protein